MLYNPLFWFFIFIYMLISIVYDINDKLQIFASSDGGDWSAFIFSVIGTFVFWALFNADMNPGDELIALLPLFVLSMLCQILSNGIRDKFHRNRNNIHNQNNNYNNIDDNKAQKDSLKSEISFQAFSQESKQFQERKIKLENHIKYEGRLSNKDIQTIKEHLGYVCMACGLDPIEEYGENMKGIMEAHHKKPYADIQEGESRTVEPDDFLILCPNCHRLIHKLGSPDDLDGLKELVNKPTRFAWWD